jgi:hypothetical protein
MSRRSITSISSTAAIAAAIGSLSLFAAPAIAGTPDSVENPPAPHLLDAREAAPQLGYATSAFGAPAQSLGASAGGGVQSEAASPNGRGWGASGTIFGSPIDRLTLIGAVERHADATSFPSAMAIFRLYGARADGFALAVSVRYKTEGFAEIGGETELGLLTSFVRGRWRGDLNAVVGAGFEEGEADFEAKARVGYDLFRVVRLGLDGQLRRRLAGDRALVGGRRFDFVAGPQLSVGLGRFYAALTAGPSTVDVATGIGFSASASFGAVAF